MKIINNVIIIALSIVLFSCQTNAYITYTPRSLQGECKVDSTNLEFNYSKFTISYSINEFDSKGAETSTYTIQNNSGETMVVDLGESYFLNNGNATRLYSNTVTSTTSVSTNGTNVNLGGITGALNIGGSVGKLANGINVGSTTTNGTVVQTFEQRYISVPPYAKITFPLFNFPAPAYSSKMGKTGEFNFIENDIYNCQHLMSYTFNPNSEKPVFESLRNKFFASHYSLTKTKSIPKKNCKLKIVTTDADQVGNTWGALGGIVGLSVEIVVLTLLLSE